ncbi:MAG: DUF302 domain-containing protein [Alphaproteobacteria bacterium]
MRRLALTILAFAMSSTAAAQSADLVTKSSAHDVPATVERLEAAIKKRGATLVAKVDHAAAAKALGMELKPATLLIFGNPRVGTPLMQVSPTVGLDLPMRVLVWQDSAGATKIGYWAPVALERSHAIKDRETVLKTMTDALDAITAEAAAK